jgi:hypothetical protein
MNQSRLDSIKQDCARLLIQFSNGYWDSRLRGTSKENQNYLDNLRVNYLFGIIKESYLVAEVVYVGDTVIPDNEIETVFDKLWHYSGIYSDVDLSDYTDITPDNGEGGAVEDGGSTIDTDTYRSGNMAVVVGSNPVTFIKDGVASPLSSNDYTVVAYVKTPGGYQQNNLQISTLTAGGFVVEDILEAGTLYYQATLNT